MTTAYIGFGSNLGDSLAILAKTKEEISDVTGFMMKRVSPVYRTKPVDVTDTQNDYINAVFEIETSLAADVVLTELNKIENRHGRKRGKVVNLARTLDLDLLLYGNKSMKSSTLVLPHPRIHQRAFVLSPLYDLSPELEIPGQGKVQALLARVGKQEVEKL